MMAGSALLALFLVQGPSADSLRQLALRLPDPALALEARARPLALRDAFTDAIARSVTAPDAGEREAQTTVARRLATAYAEAWRDSFLLDQVARFTAWTPARRRTKVWADSLRRHGVAVYGRDGPNAAIAIWQRALARVRAIGDTAGEAALRGNIGAGHFAEGRPDSAAQYLERARLLAGAIGDIRVEANAEGMLAEVSVGRGDLADGRRRYARAAELRERIGDTRGMAADLNNLGLLAQSLGQGDEARERFEAALALNRREGREPQAATNLLNLAGLASTEGDFAQAESRYRDALAIWRAREEWTSAAAALHGLGQLAIRRGDYPGARTALEEALGIYRRTGPVGEALAVQRDLTAALAAAGQLQGAMDGLREAERVADSARVGAGLHASLTLARADLATQLNRLADAERLYARAERLFLEDDDGDGAAAARQGRGTLLILQDDRDGARNLLAAALRSQVAAGDRRAAALTRLSLGELERARGDTASARRRLTRAAGDFARLGDPVGSATALGALAGLRAAAGLPVAAESLYQAALDRLGNRLAPETAWPLHAGLGRVQRSRGALDAAARSLRTAVAVIEQAGSTLTLPERRAAFLADKWEVYADLAAVERGRGRPGAAFEVSERLRARAMVEILAQGRFALPAAPEPALASREQDLRRRLRELASGVDGGGTVSARRGPDDPAAGPTAEALRRTQEAYTETLLELRERAPRQAELVAPEIPKWQDVARRLAPDEAMIEYLVGDSGSVAFVIRGDSLAIVDLGVRRHELARLVELARGTLEPADRLHTDSLWRAPLRRLHASLIEPIEEAGLLAGRSRLILVPQAELHYLPFAALRGGPGRERFLVERYELSSTPSATVWLALGDRSPGRAGKEILALAPRPEALPASRREVETIGRRWGPSTLTLIGEAGSEARFRREAPGRGIVHLATYGVLNRQNPLFSYVQLAPGEGHDGRLETHEVFGLQMDGALVVLSACQTGLGSGLLADVPAGDDWVSLTRAFLHAGADRVVATLWAVEDLPTASLMERFYTAMAAGAGPDRALAEAQRAMLANEVTAHPFQWAAFVAVGGPSSRIR